MAESPVVLTRQQARAMEAFLYVYSDSGFDNEACDGAIWDVGVRPWPTASNLVTKGLLADDGWLGPEEGHNYRLTDAGREHMARLVAERSAAGLVTHRRFSGAA